VTDYRVIGNWEEMLYLNKRRILKTANINTQLETAVFHNRKNDEFPQTTKTAHSQN